MNSKNLKINNKNGLVYITFPRLEACGAVRHIFSTRIGGVSRGQYSLMNTSFSGGDSFENVEHNYRLLCGAVGIDVADLVLSRQTHTNNVRVVTKSDCGTGYTKPSFCDVDGLITNESGVALVTQYADCTPLLFCDPVKHVCATSHAGWRGTVAQIGAVTVEKMVNEFGCDPQNIIAAIGPCICEKCYEVDTPVYNAFADSGINLDGVFSQGKDQNHFMLNLVRANKNILLSAGIKEDNIDISDVCTCCNSTELHSHRATGGKRGSLAAIIELV